MEPLTIIVTALVAGATAALKDTAAQAVKDVYSELKGLIIAKFGGKAEVSEAIASVESNPASTGRRETLREELEAAGAGHDPLVVQQAQVLLDLLKSRGLLAAPSYQAELHGSGAIAQGSGATAAGERDVAIGGSVSGSTIVTGDKNVVRPAKYSVQMDHSEHVAIGDHAQVIGGDVVHGDKADGDIFGGDKMTTGDISGAVAMGRGASASQGLSAEEVARLFAAIYERIEARPEDPTVDKEEIKETVEKIEQETAKGEQANPSKVERWLKFLAGMAPDIWDVVVATLINPVNGIAEVVRKVAKRAREEKAGQAAG